MADRMDQTIRIPAKPEAAYEVRIGRGLLCNILPEVRALLPGIRPFVVTDASLEQHGHAAALLEGQEADKFVINPPGERSKNLRTVEAIVNEMERVKCGRDTVILALGGGTVGDIAAFAAAIFKRGIPCVQIPTTTVSQADSAIGGKAGVDSELSKNAYGAFHHPARVYVDCDTLLTLDDRHYRAGLVESVKHAMIADAAYFEYLEANVDALLQRDMAVLQHLAVKNCAIKGNVVFQDPEECGLRHILNYGHTLGHAIETVSGFELLHGEAVAIGIIGACHLAAQMELAPLTIGSRARALLERLGISLAIPAAIAAEALVDTTARDKKARNRTPRFVLLKKIADIYTVAGAHAVPVPEELLKNVIENLRDS